MGLKLTVSTPAFSRSTKFTESSFGLSFPGQSASRVQLSAILRIRERSLDAEIVAESCASYAKRIRAERLGNRSTLSKLLHYYTSRIPVRGVDTPWHVQQRPFPGHNICVRTSTLLNIIWRAAKGHVHVYLSGADLGILKGGGTQCAWPYESIYER